MIQNTQIVTDATQLATEAKGLTDAEIRVLVKRHSHRAQDATTKAERDSACDCIDRLCDELIARREQQYLAPDATVECAGCFAVISAGEQCSCNGGAA